MLAKPLRRTRNISRKCWQVTLPLCPAGHAACGTGVGTCWRPCPLSHRYRGDPGPHWNHGAKPSSPAPNPPKERPSPWHGCEEGGGPPPAAAPALTTALWDMASLLPIWPCLRTGGWRISLIPSQSLAPEGVAWSQPLLQKTHLSLLQLQI